MIWNEINFSSIEVISQFKTKGKKKRNLIWFSVEKYGYFWLREWRINKVEVKIKKQWTNEHLNYESKSILLSKL